MFTDAAAESVGGFDEAFSEQAADVRIFDEQIFCRVFAWEIRVQKLENRIETFQTPDCKLFFPADLQYGFPRISQTASKSRQNQYAGNIDTYTSEKKYGCEQYQETESLDSIIVIGFDFFPHRKYHSTAKQTNHALNDYRGRAGYPVFPEIPGQETAEKDI